MGKGYVSTSFNNIVIDSESTDVEYPSAKAVYDELPTPGTYTPAIYNTNNLDEMLLKLSMYYRIGNIVTLAITIEAEAISPGACSGEITIPIASNFTYAEDLIGVCATRLTSGVATAQITNNRIYFQYEADSTGSRYLNFNIFYLVK